jgi:cbb3-type cytochrome oxidase subunit 1
VYSHLARYFQAEKTANSISSYLDIERVYINKGQLGTEDVLYLGWIYKAHPAFAFRDGMKVQLQAIMNKEFKDIK